MVNQDDVMDCINKADRPVSLQDIADNCGIPWNESTRKNLDKKVKSLCRFRMAVKIDNNGSIAITAYQKETQDRGRI